MLIIFCQAVCIFPVGLMYCNIFGTILKKRHTPLYIIGLGDKTFSLGKIRISQLLINWFICYSFNISQQR